MDKDHDTLRQISDLASQAVRREIDALVAARAIDSLATSIGLGLDGPFLILKGIVSQADHIPDLDQLHFWDSTSAAVKHEERRSFLAQFADQILNACEDILTVALRHDK